MASVSTAASAGWRWGKLLGLSLIDQGLASMANFLLNVGLARLLRPADYGAFATGYAGLLLLAGAHTALIAEPASVLGPARHPHRLDAYLRATVRLDAGLCAGLAAALFVLAIALGRASPDAALIVLGLAVATPLVLLSQLLRRACYVTGELGRATGGSLGYGLAMVAAVWWIARSDLASPLAGYLALAAAAAVSLAVYVPGFRLGGRPAEERPGLREVVRANWEYGRWMLAAGIAHWLGPGLYVPALAALAGLEAAGGFRAMINLVTPFEQALGAIGLLLLPRLALRRSAAHSRQAALALWLFTALLAAPYVALLVVFGRSLVSWLYGGDSYLSFAEILPTLAVFVLVLSVNYALTLLARAGERTRLVLRSKLAAAAVSSTVGLGLALAWGARGAAIGIVLAVGAECLALAAGRISSGEEPQR